MIVRTLPMYKEHTERLIHGIHAHHGAKGVLYEMLNTLEKPRLTRLAICANGHGSNRQMAFTSLNHCFAIADDGIRGAVENRRDELRNIGTEILVVTVRVDDDVRAKLEAGIDTIAETASQSDVALVADDVVDADLAGYVSRAVGAGDLGFAGLYRGSRKAVVSALMWYR